MAPHYPARGGHITHSRNFWGKHPHRPPNVFPDFGLGPFRKARGHLKGRVPCPLLQNPPRQTLALPAPQLRTPGCALWVVLGVGDGGSEVGGAGIRPPGAQGWAGRGPRVYSPHRASRLGLRGAFR